VHSGYFGSEKRAKRGFASLLQSKEFGEKRSGLRITRRNRERRDATLRMPSTTFFGCRDNKKSLHHEKSEGQRHYVDRFVTVG